MIRLAPSTPDSVRVLVVAGATQPMDSAALGRVTEYVEAGGAALVLVEPVLLNPQSADADPRVVGPRAVPSPSGGIELSSGMVLDLASSERGERRPPGSLSGDRSLPALADHRAGGAITPRRTGSPR